MVGMTRFVAPLPTRDGLSPSHLHLPAGQWPSLLAFLVEYFPHVAAAVWHARLTAGLVVDDQGVPYRPDSAYIAHQRIWYYREVVHEVPVPFAAPVLFRDERLVVADKPHLLAAVPAGHYVRETLLTRLRLELDMPALTPLHRLDRETAGVMLFCTRPEDRGRYQTLFQRHEVRKEYEAIAPFCAGLALPLIRRSRLEERGDSFLMEEVDGEPNSETCVELIERHGDLARYRLMPSSGKKHQLRAHLAALGIGIRGDRWYPQLLPERAADDFSAPLQLLARSIAFIDPFDGRERQFSSGRSLSWPAG
jgi:tRNA pseudouridine32 synthase/23S rRNA pseudouridine746 synthase